MKHSALLQSSLCRIGRLRHRVVMPVAGHLREPTSGTRGLVASALCETVPPSVPVGAASRRAAGIDKSPELLSKHRRHDKVNDGADDGIHHRNALNDEE